MLKLQARLDQNNANVPGSRGESPMTSPEMKSAMAHDVDHIVASRDREIRALNGERDSLQKEVREGKKR